MKPAQKKKKKKKKCSIFYLHQFPVKAVCRWLVGGRSISAVSNPSSSRQASTLVHTIAQDARDNHDRKLPIPQQQERGLGDRNQPRSQMRLRDAIRCQRPIERACELSLKYRSPDECAFWQTIGPVIFPGSTAVVNAGQRPRTSLVDLCEHPPHLCSTSHIWLFVSLIQIIRDFLLALLIPRLYVAMEAILVALAATDVRAPPARGEGLGTRISARHCAKSSIPHESTLRSGRRSK